MVFLASTPRPNYLDAVVTINRIPGDLAAAQKRLGITTKTLAAQMSVTSTTVSRLLTGSTPTQPTILAALRWLAEH